MRFRGPLIGLSVFMVIALAMTWLVYATLRREVAGSTNDYSAMFTDATGLRDGDDVRIAGVRVGRVESVAIDGDVARSTFGWRPDNRCTATRLRQSPTRTSLASATSACPWARRVARIASSLEA